MKTHYTLLFFLISVSVFAQNAKDYRLLLRNGSFTPEKNIQPGNSGTIKLREASDTQKSFVIIQFDKIPGEDEKNELKKEGIELLDYVPNYAYTAIITGPLNNNSLSARSARAIVTLTAEQKMQTSLANGIIPEHAVKVKGMADVWISYPKSFSFSEIQAGLAEHGFRIVSDLYKDYQIIELRLPADKLKELALLPFVQYVQAVPAEDKSFNDKSTVNGRANVLRSALTGGRNLTGEGVVVGVGDESNPLRHADFSGRIINRAAIEGGDHGLHVMGTVGGAGIVNERYTGYAPKATLIVQEYSKIFAFAPAYVKDFGMVITNNSYGEDVNTCETFGEYNLYSYILDRQAFQMPYLQHVFAAGNSGSASCSPYPTNFGNVLSGYQTAKNVISVGNTSSNSLISSSSSRGPVKDGRIKPEIMAQGQSVASTIPVDLYGILSGTSMAAPAVSGGLALLNQRYRQLHQQSSPKNALMKALLINGGTDKGNDGPDYQYGFGWMNLLRSVTMLENNAFVNDSVINQESKAYTINVPANTAKLKVMLYWNDPASAIISARNLVNDLDLRVSSNAGNVLPEILDSTPSNVNNPATTGADHINNIEQVMIENPVSGTYTIHVNGTLIAQNPRQEYVVVYDVIPTATTLTYPIGNEHLIAGETMNISWDSFGDTESTFKLRYSLDNGQTWPEMSAENLVPGTRQFSWVIPLGIVANKARIKIIHNSTGLVSISEPFVIVNTPTVSLSAEQCEGYIGINWTEVTGATKYEVMLLRGNEMISEGITTERRFVIKNLSRDTTYWVAVRAIVNDSPGRRSRAISRKPDNGNCSGSISDNDLKIEAILSPASSGRKNTSSELGANTSVTIKIRNLDDLPVNGGFTLTCLVNGTSIATDQTVSQSIEAGGSIDYTFPSPVNLSETGDYVIKVTLNHTGDPSPGNNVISKTFRQLANPAVILPLLDDLETLAVQSYSMNQKGFAGGDRYDFSTDSDAGRVRTFVNTGIAFSGNRAVTLDANRYYAAGTSVFLDATFNLSAYNIASDNVRLDFNYKNHGQQNHPDNKVWIRGSDTDNWIEACDLFANQNSPNEGYKLASGIEIGNLLFANNQQLTSSFQIRWGQHGNMLTADNSSGAGYTFDNIKLFISTNDVQVVSINHPSEQNCALGSEEVVSVTIRNTSAANLTDIPVSYKLGNSEEIQEIIPLIEARSNKVFNFSAKADLSAFGLQQLKVKVDFPTDNYELNDTLQFSFYNTPLISSFPYLQNFEAGDGFWQSLGENSSWQYGTPVSAKINRAASGSKAWKTNLSGNYNDRESSFLYSPCFNIGGLAAPTLSFSLALDMEVCDPNVCDIAYVEYSGDGAEWTKLGATGAGTNWYNKTISGASFWSMQNYTRWHVATFALPAGITNLRLRFVFKSDPFVNREGIAIDDIHIYDRANGIYDETTTETPVTQNIPAQNTWANFMKNGKLIASVNPENQNMGATDVQAYLHAQAIRYTKEQYYLNRSIAIKPAVTGLANPASVRLYILDSEIEALLNATGCISCVKPSGAYELGVSKYTDPGRTTEDGDFANSKNGSWSFYSFSDLTMVPYDKGYYVELKVNTFSEFWFSKSLLGTPAALPVELIRFTAKKQPSAESQNNVLLEWATGTERNFDHFEVELAYGNEDFKLNRFVKIADIRGEGSETASIRQYTFTDREVVKSGVRYYRLKMVDLDGSFRYSQIRPIVFENKIEWNVYPNPSAGDFNIVYQAAAGAEVDVKVLDLNGRLRINKKYVATGFVEKQQIGLSGQDFSPGLYVLEVVTGQQKQVFKVIKE